MCKTQCSFLSDDLINVVDLKFRTSYLPEFHVFRRIHMQRCRCFVVLLGDGHKVSGSSVQSMSHLKATGNVASITGVNWILTCRCRGPLNCTCSGLLPSCFVGGGRISQGQDDGPFVLATPWPWDRCFVRSRGNAQAA